MNEVDFDLIDDVLGLEVHEYANVFRNSYVNSIGPIVEFTYQNYDDFEGQLELLPPANIVEHLRAALRSTSILENPKVHGSPRVFEFLRTPHDANQITGSAWAAYSIRAQKAAELSGIEKRFAQALIGTMDEMVENIIWHSGSASTGLTGYRWERGWFEYVVADSGVGVLESLRTNPKYREIFDSEEALTIALSNGGTRFSETEARGTGFNSLVGNIAKKSSNLRFRTGTARTALEGISARLAGHPSIWKNGSGPNIRGFTISVVCHTPF